MTESEFLHGLLKAETGQLDKMVDDTARAMRMKLRMKAGQGYRGWADHSCRGTLGRKLREHVERAAEDPEQWIDVANFAAMLWWGHQLKLKRVDFY